MEIKDHKIEKFEFVQVEDSPHYFSDIVEIKVVDDRICLSFGIKNTETKQAHVSHRVFFTLNHFIRFSKICKESSDFIEKNIDKFSKPNEK